MLIMENPIKMDDLGVPLFFGNTQIQMMVFFVGPQAQVYFLFSRQMHGFPGL